LVANGDQPLFSWSRLMVTVVHRSERLSHGCDGLGGSSVGATHRLSEPLGQATVLWFVLVGRAIPVGHFAIWIGVTWRPQKADRRVRP
jgi:hypothetical protein